MIHRSQYSRALSFICAEVARDADITLTELLNNSRRREYVWPRQYAMWRARQETDASLPQIGRFFRRDHTTVLHAIRAVERREAAYSAKSRENDTGQRAGTERQKANVCADGSNGQG